MSVTLNINGKSMQTAAGPSIFDCAERVDVRVPTSCQKQGKCRECMVEVVGGMELLSEPTAEEQHLSAPFRLSCRAHITGQSGVIRCHTMRRGQMRVLETAHSLQRKPEDDLLDPAVRRDGERILLDSEEIARSTGPIHGLAVDLGTTTVVVNLVNLETGKIVATTSFENPQRFGGSDVMARIQYDCDHKGRLLQRTLLGYLSHAIQDLPGDPQTIYEAVIVGNSTMRDLFYGLSVYTIGQRPYRSIIEHELLEKKRDTTSLAVPAKQLRLPIHPKARVYSLPLIGSHVGADAAACLLAIGIAQEERIVAVMDIGTNTELVVGNKHKLLAASCPAGPAFEGGGIRCGMPGLEGAIERIHIEDDGRVCIGVIGDESAAGICGSGLIDLLGEMIRTGRMDSTGRFVEGVREPFVVDAAGGIGLYEQDISNLAQAKGANIAGLQIVMQHYGIEFGDLHRFYLAGGFAHHMDLDDARRIGFVPDLNNDTIVQIGNAAIEGATIALRSVTRRREIEQLVRKIEHVELESDPAFFDYFVLGCLFNPVQSAALLS